MKIQLTHNFNMTTFDDVVHHLKLEEDRFELVKDWFTRRGGGRFAEMAPRGTALVEPERSEEGAMLFDARRFLRGQTLIVQHSHNPPCSARDPMATTPPSSLPIKLLSGLWTFEHRQDASSRKLAFQRYLQAGQIGHDIRPA